MPKNEIKRAGRILRELRQARDGNGLEWSQARQERNQ